MYRTGDLVRYNDDGSLTFIGRRDAQVKIHGQRIELGEIEGQMTRLTATRQAACLFPSSGPAANRLVAVLSVHGSQQDSSVDKNHNAPTAVLAAASGEHVDRHLSALQSLIREALPAYMVPTVWIALEELPLSAAGKLDRRSLQSWLNNIDAQAYTSIVRTEDEEDKGPVSSSSGDEGMIEKVLRETCSHILNVDEANININRSFISNGGDSISAMRLSAEGRTKGLVFSVADLLKGKSLAAFAQTLKAPVAANERTSHVEELFDVDFALSPIQQWFMTQYPNQDDLPSDGYGNQGFYLKLTRRVTPEAMAKAVAVIVDTHSMLRARFERTTTSKGGTWVQRVSRPGDGPHCLSSLHISSFAEIESLAKTRHASLNIREGSIFTADLCILPSEEQYLLFIAHHLVVDLVSWRVILDDLEILINGGSIRPVDISFHHWTQLQASRALEIDMKRVLSTDGIYNNLDFWNFTTETPNTVGDHDHHHLVIDEHTTSSVLSSNINGTLNTEPVDLLISAVWDAFFRIFPDREKLTIFSEGHGRESWSSDIDLSRTVGWFTTISPVSVSRGDMVSKGESIAKTIRFVKDARRRLTANGWEYFTTRYLHPEGREAFQPHSSSPAMEVVFNYHGQFQQFEGGASLFETVDLQGVSEQGPALPAGSLFGVEVSIENGRARYDFSFNRHLNHHNRIVQWAEQIGPSLSAICDELASSAPSKTLCDLEFLKLDYNALDRFHERVVSGVQALYQSGVEDAIPCSPTVDGILLSQVRQPEAYKTLQLYEISSTEPVSANQLSQAWQQVVARQPALRSIFVPGLDSSAAFSQVILQSYHGEMVIVESSNQGNRDAALHALKQLPAVDYQQEFRPPHRVALCQVNKNTVLCQVECSHAITDGASTAIVGQDWVRAYTGTLNSFTTVDLLDTTRAFARSLAARSSDDKMAYWKTKLDGAEPCHFPNISGDGEVGDRSGTVSAIIDGLVFQRIRDFCASHSITVGSVMNSVWALTLSAYTSSRAVCFGYLASGRDLPIAGLDESMGAYANMLVSYVDVDRDLDTAAFARRIHDQTLHDLDHQHCSLASIQHELGLPAGRALFNTIVSFQKTDDRGETNGGVDGGLSFTVLDGEDPTEYDIVLNIGHGAGGIDLVLDYSPSCLSRNNVGRVLSLFQKIASYMASGEALKSMDLASDDDLHDIFSWNHKVPSTANDCVHHLIRDATRRYPENQAVCAWDGEFNYAELDSLSTRLAHRLIDHGVRRGVIVPLCLDKSKWTPVAMMGVMKAGGASVAMDAGQPIERLRTIVGQVQPVVILCSASKTDFANGLAESTVAIEVVDQENLSALLPPLLVRELPDVVPSDTLYIVFTSGSTGVPKGVVVTHANIANAILHQRHILGLTPTSRVYDFSGYMFDVVWCNMYQALSIGGCLCIPGDHDRKSDFIGAIDRLSADVAIFTPSAIRGLEPGALNKLRNLHFIGEPLYVDAFQQIDPQVTITNLYGPSECTTFATAQPVVGREAQAIGIGGGFGLNTWIVEPISGHSLMPIGGIGELWLEGPLVASGYLGDAEKTTSVFVNNPAWLSRGVDNYQGRKGRLYKTGDLVRYDEHGSLQFVGRKDSQVKINGQRVELGEVEVNIRTVLDGAARQVIAEVFTPQQSGNAILVAFIELSAASSDISETELYKLAAVITSRVDESLASRLPAHMIPSFYVPVSSIPVTGTGKTDRKTLRTIGAALTLDQLGVTRLSDGKVKRQPNTAMEKRLQTLWAAVLKMEDPGRISADDSFLRIGGDSIVAMRLVGAARASGLTFSVADVLRHPKLSDLAVEISGVEQSEVTTGQAMTVKGIERFSLLKSGLNVAEAVRVATAALDGIEEDQIEDMYPCTPLQEGMLALTSIRPNEYIAKCALELRSSVDPGRFRQAWSSLVASTPILRTRILDISDEGLVQAVINQKSEKEEKEENQQVMGLRKPLFHVRLSEERDRCVFYLTIHHALYDGWSLGLLFERLEAIYLQKSIPPVPDYKTFVKYATSIDQGSALKFWSHQLQGLNAEIFPSLPSPFYQPKPDKVATYHIDDLRMGTNSDVTLSTIVRAAFALVIADYSDNDDDVVFGVTVTGRQTAVPGIEDMIGPTIATVPIRISIDREEELHAYLTRVQTQSIEMISFEQIGLQNIRGLSSDAKRACSFQTLLIVQPAEEAAEWSSEIIMRDIHEVDENSADNEGMLQQDDTYALTVECHLRKDGSLRLRIGYDSTVLEEKQVQRLAQQFKHILHQICASNNDTLSITQLQTLNSDDARDIWSWNVTLPDTVNVCVHDRISAMAFQLPDKLAVCACDGDWTYHELDSLSTHLAFHLRRLGVNTETIVPLVFEKSKWAPVAMLSVMKAGGASVLVDTAQPEERLRAIIQQVSPSVVLSSTGKHELASRLAAGAAVQTINEAGLRALNRKLGGEWPVLPRVSPSSRLYIVFTSGSTGTPKGVVITHANFSSALTHQREAQGISSSTRLFDFASYAFDVAWANTLTAFECGATLCIPSDADRKDDLNGAIAMFRPTHIDVTPSAALILSAESLRQLDSMTLGGERLTAEWARRWAPHVSLKNSYGPSECTPTATFTQAIPPDGSFAGSIGAGAGVNTWVVDAATGAFLVPIGSSGELWLEGPIVGAGYLDDETKTTGAFIKDPPWLLQGSGVGHLGRQGRLYKTGDLVRYNQDGSLTFVGRADNQVKINGQRVELGEIESHMARHDNTHQTVCLIPSSGPCAKRVVAFFSLRDAKRESTDTTNTIELLTVTAHSKSADRHIQALEALLSETLPSYMIPSIWAPLWDLPMTASGKLDRKTLNTWLISMDAETYRMIANVASGQVAQRVPHTAVESLLVDAVSRVLNIAVADIDLGRSFISNGGDSISAMRLSSQWRAAASAEGFSVAALMRSKSLADFAQALSPAAGTMAARIDMQEEAMESPFGLSPIQQWFFEQLESPKTVTQPDYHYNQGFYVKMTNRTFSEDEVAGAVERLVNHHSMLRARFERIEGSWLQSVSKANEGTYHFASHKASSLNKVASLAMQSHVSINIEHGRVFSADLCAMPSTGEQYLILIAHHLVIDLVSWRILLDDLETLLSGGTLQHSLPFQTWAKLQQAHVSSSPKFLPEKLLSTKDLGNDLDFWGFTPSTPNNNDAHSTCLVEIGRETTSQLLGAANDTYNTEPVDLLLSAVWDAFLSTFSRRQGLTIFSEAHGREPWSAVADTVDLSRTVGWFTTISPISVSRDDTANAANIVRLVKDARRRLPANGWAYFASRYLNPEAKKVFEAHTSTMEVTFNYHGQFQQLESEESFFKDVTLPGVSEQGSAIPASSLFNIEVSLEGGVVQFEVSFNRHINHQSDIQEWISLIAPSLQSICKNLVNTRSRPSRTLCDYEFLTTDYPVLDNFQTGLATQIESLNGSAIEEVYPCTPTVDGILLSQTRQASSYITVALYEISSRDKKPVDIDHLIQSWQKVVAYQPALRSIFIGGLDASAAFNQVVIKTYRGEVVLLPPVEDRAFAAAALSQLPTLDYTQVRPPHRVALVPIQGKVVVKIEMSHAITDGASASILIEDWIQAYIGTLSTVDLLSTTSGYVRALQTGKTKDEKLGYWKKKLADVEPCYFPALARGGFSSSSERSTAATTSASTISIKDALFARIQQFYSAPSSVTPASLLQSAWARTLSAYTSNEGKSVVFGYLCSGRDAPVAGIDLSVGAYANMMVCRAEIETTGRDGFLRGVHEQIMQDMDYQHCSLAEIQHELGAGRGLFNSVVSFQRVEDEQQDATGAGLAFEGLDGLDPTEVTLP
jgi:amino acid adenylation domain-containing protein/non-ribosomal peptide synthase protein (TIGR01720 family)